MDLPQDFQFNQANLQDFSDCRRRFLLRYLKRLAWPAIETDPVLEHERYLQQGVAFHRLAQQYLLGIPFQNLSNLVNEPTLERWWQNFIPFAEAMKERQATSSWKLYPEIGLSAPLAGSRLVAKYDLVVVSPQGSLSIYDWKTNRTRPRREWLERRLQTRVYPYLLARAGAHLNHGKPIQPDQIEMIYWFADYPADMERFTYTQAAFEADDKYLVSLVDTILNLQESEFYLTSDEKRCAFCTYRSLCNRGISAGHFDEQILAAEDQSQEVLVDFEQIAEIEF